MAYARHIGRVGALAVTLGIGTAIANAPGIAYAETPGASAGDSETKTTSSDTTNEADQQKPSTSATPGDEKSSPSGRKAPHGTVLRAVVGVIRNIAEGNIAGGNDAGATSRLDKKPSAGSESADRKTSNNSTQTTRLRARTNNLADASETLETAATSFNQRIEQAVQKYTTPQAADTGRTALNTAPQTFTTAAVQVQQPSPRPRTSVVPIFTNALGSLLQPLVSPGSGSPQPQLPTLAAVLVAVRDEVERLFLPRRTQVAYPPRTDEPVDPGLPSDTNQHVLVIAIDGTNMSKVLEDPATNDKFVSLMSTSTVSTPSIVGHTTVSNPSWTAILTGAWDNKTGVINNVYTPTTYDRWPTVFTQLEKANPDIRTKAIADWDVIGAIAASGKSADEVVYVKQVEGDTNWSLTDGEVTTKTVETLAVGEYQGEAPNFMVTYLVQVDEAGHMYGGDSPEYAAAIARTDENLGAILKAVADREAATCADGGAPCEDWTIIVVTDHGHQPQPGFGHGFQSPRETDTFVIVNGPQFDTPDCNTTCARFNPDYEIVDVTPTVLSLFGAPQPPRTDGVPLQSLNGRSSDLLTEGQLEELLVAQMASNDYPNIIVNVALSVRTIVAFLPYYVHGADLPAPLGDILYVATNVPAQLVAFGTGVYGARLFPILPPPPAITFIPDQATIQASLRADCGDPTSTACVAV